MLLNLCGCSVAWLWMVKERMATMHWVIQSLSGQRTLQIIGACCIFLPPLEIAFVGVIAPVRNAGILYFRCTRIYSLALTGQSRRAYIIPLPITPSKQLATWRSNMVWCICCLGSCKCSIDSIRVVLSARWAWLCTDYYFIISPGQWIVRWY